MLKGYGIHPICITASEIFNLPRLSQCAFITIKSHKTLTPFWWNSSLKKTCIPKINEIIHHFFPGRMMLLHHYSSGGIFRTNNKSYCKSSKRKMQEEDLSRSLTFPDFLPFLAQNNEFYPSLISSKPHSIEMRKVGMHFPWSPDILQHDQIYR